MRPVGRYGQVGHLAFSASELLSGGASNAWRLRYAVFLYFPPSFVILVVHPVFQVIMAALPSSFQVPVIPSPLVAFATPPLDNVISKGRPAVSLTFHTPSNALAARLARTRHSNQAGHCHGRPHCVPDHRSSSLLRTPGSQTTASVT